MKTDLEHLEELERAATKGRAYSGGLGTIRIETKVGDIGNPVADGEYMSALRNAAPAMIQELKALRAEVEGLKEKLKDDQERVDAVVYYRNLAIVLGAKPNQMRGESDSKLCEMGIDPDDDEGGYSVSMNDVIHENEKLWDAAGEAHELRAQLATAREAIQSTVDLLESSRKAHSKGSPEYDALFIRCEVGGVLEDALKKTTKGGGA